jgi:diguanylate cyclase
MIVSTSEKSSGILKSWLGRRGSDGPSTGNGASAKVDLVTQGRRLLLDAIAEFLLDNDLAVTPDNLGAALGVFSGANPPLARQIAARLQVGDPITQEWLDEATANCAAEQTDDAIERLMGKLEENLDAFGKTSKAARSVTAEYSGQLEQHVTELAQADDAAQSDDPAQIIANLTELAKAMSERTRKLEQDMRRSEEQSEPMRRSLDRAKRDAEIDHLTGLPNRRAFETLIERHYREAQAAIEPLSVAFCDIDHFKLVNDTHGHDAGDRVIRIIADALAQISNDNCHVARHGGEEFVMLFRGLPPAEAKARLDRTREELAGRVLVNRKSEEPFGQISFSGGVANVFAYSDPRAALSAADEALYKAKQAGRNQIMIA